MKPFASDKKTSTPVIDFVKKNWKILAAIAVVFFMLLVVLTMPEGQKTPTTKVFDNTREPLTIEEKVTMIDRRVGNLEMKMEEIQDRLDRIEKSLNRK